MIRLIRIMFSGVLNFVLFTELVLYIFTLFIGFRIRKDKKDKHNRLYLKYRLFLYVLIAMIFGYSLALLFLASKEVWWLIYVMTLEFMFVMYFYSFVFRQTRCWKQHRILLFNFVLIPVIYFCSLALDDWRFNCFVVVIYVYNILEFQFAKFRMSQVLIWD